MNFVKTFFSSLANAFKIFKSKELLELLYLSYTAFKQIYYDPTILFVSFLILTSLLFTKTNSILFLILIWFFNVYCLAFLRPSVDLKNYKYFLSNLLVPSKLLSIFLLMFYLPYSILHFEFLPSDSVAIGIFWALFGLFTPFKFSFFKILGASVLSLFGILILIGFKGLIYHFLLMGYLNFEIILHWLLRVFMFDRQLFSLFGLASFCISPAIVFLILSALDSKKSCYYQVKGLVKGLKLFLLNYPISFICFHLFRLLIVYAYKFLAIGIFNNLLFMIGFFILYYFYLAFLTNIYVEKVHEQF